MEPLEAVLIGAGNRGRFTYAAYARRHPGRLRLVALAEPDPVRRRTVGDELGLPEEARLADWREALARPGRARAAIVATGDTLHVGPALAAFDAGLHVLLEKPIALSPAECVRVVEAAERSGLLLQISHVLRYAPFYTAVRRTIESGSLGDLVAVDMKEHVAHWHMTHSYVRGKFRRRSLAAPLLLAKCCHDLDLLAWFADRPARRVSSFGSLDHYRAGRAPAGAPTRCTDGCPVQSRCPHDAVRFYAGPDDALASMWPWSDVSPDASRSARLRALETGPYGRCVYHCDNDVSDRQVVITEFDDGLAASFTVHGHGTHESRTLRLTGTLGELRGVLHRGVLEVTRHGSLEVERIEVPADPLGHFGGDAGLLDHFTDVASRDAVSEARTSGRIALESHLLGFAAERARERGEVVDMEGWRRRAREEAA